MITNSKVRTTPITVWVTDPEKYAIQYLAVLNKGTVSTVLREMVLRECAANGITLEDAPPLEPAQSLEEIIRPIVEKILTERSSD